MGFNCNSCRGRPGEESFDLGDEKRSIKKKDRKSAKIAKADIKLNANIMGAPPPPPTVSKSVKKGNIPKPPPLPNAKGAKIPPIPPVPKAGALPPPPPPPKTSSKAKVPPPPKKSKNGPKPPPIPKSISPA